MAASLWAARSPAGLWTCASKTVKWTAPASNARFALNPIPIAAARSSASFFETAGSDRSPKPFWISTYEEGSGGPFPPAVRDFTLENIACRKSKRALYLRGYRNDPIRDIKLINLRVEHTSAPDVIENVEGLQRS